MEKRNVVLVAVCGVILAAFLSVATIKILQKSGTPPPAEEETVAEVEPPAPERRHGPRVRRKVDIGSTFSGMAPVQQNNAANAEPERKELHNQTPEEAVESAWQALDTYREQSEEDRNKTKFALGIVNVILNAVSANAGQLAAGMNDQQRADAVVRAQAALENINAIEQEVVPDMNEDERQALGSTIQAIHTLSATFLNELQ
ncbi:MAG: hypothetical protein J6Y92_10305 [Lentisphaeria bacterium]|nr:hypothetical protein [Lentisphaeria bacterium]